MPKKKRDDESIRLPEGAGPPPSEPLDPLDDRSGGVTEMGTPEPDDTYQSREGYDDLGGGFIPDEGEPNDETVMRRPRDDEEVEIAGSPASGDRRGRRQPDETLARDIQEVLTADPELDATGIDVDVQGGAVTLRGRVVSSEAKLLAGELVESMIGVSEVDNRLSTDEET
jgi:hypothetical protein